MTQAKNLLQLCGLDPLPSHPSGNPRWLKATLQFVGAENYVLGIKHVEVVFTSGKSGFNMQFRHQVAFQATQLLGKHNETGALYDIRLVFDGDMPTFSLACLSQGRYPRVLRKGEVVHVD